MNAARGLVAVTLAGVALGSVALGSGLLGAACGGDGGDGAPVDEDGRADTVAGNDDTHDDERSLAVAASMDPTSFVHTDAGPLRALEGPPVVPCGPGGLVPEGDALEIRTAWCDPADVTAPLPVDVPAGTLVDLTLVHSALVADGGHAHFALFVGDETLWTHEIPIPAPATFLSPRVVVQQAHAAGTPVVLHVHNHGSNTYKLVGLRLSSP